MTHWGSDRSAYDYQFRFVIVGDSTVGKSSLLKYFVCAQFCHDTEPTVGVDFYVRTLVLEDGVTIKLQLWDTAGQERFRSITSSYFRNCAGVLLVFDLTKRLTFHHIPDWMNECKQHNSYSQVTFCLIGHKADLHQDREVTKREASLFADFHDMGYYETSSIDGRNISEALAFLTQQVHDTLTSSGGDVSNAGIVKGHRESVVQLNNAGTVAKCSSGRVARGSIIGEIEVAKDRCCQG